LQPGDHVRGAWQERAGSRGAVPACPRILTASLSDFITSSLTHATCRGWPGSGTQALGWKILSEREREIVIGTDEHAPVGMCFMPVTDPKTVKNRVHLDLTSSAQDRDQEIERLLALGARRVTSGRPAQGPGPFWPTPKETNSA
jgi:hypothetical protein